ncbi:hypothetical protein Fot_37700 [Forsythia ovata]|uniref:Uncharacterized protein n=1 Tax=Forsythia ovata TaxID=205694 RepID=A0ABD1S1Y1_9LAMI
MVAQGSAKGNFPKQKNQGRQTRLQDQNHKVDVNEVTPTRSKNISEVLAPHPWSKYCRIHPSDNHDTEECPEVRTTVDKMVENRYKAFWKSDKIAFSAKADELYLPQGTRSKNKR